jgi:hypothetical protein
VLGNLGLELSLWLWLLNDPEVVTAVIIKQTPNGGWCRGPAVLPATGLASWVAARLWLLWGPPLGLDWSAVEASWWPLLVLGWAGGGLLWPPLVSCWAASCSAGLPSPAGLLAGLPATGPLAAGLSSGL